MQPRLYYSLCGESRFPSQVGCLRLGHTLPWCAQAARCPGLELSPATEKIIKNRTRCRQLSSSLRASSSHAPAAAGPEARRPGLVSQWVAQNASRSL